jgi:hypothetical protein
LLNDICSVASAFFVSLNFNASAAENRRVQSRPATPQRPSSSQSRLAEVWP